MVLYYLHIQLTDTAPETIKSTNVIGVDFDVGHSVTSARGEWKTDKGRQINSVCLSRKRKAQKAQNAP